MQSLSTQSVALASLPYDLIRELCSLLQAVDIAALLSTCRNLHSLYREEAIWLALCRPYGVDDTNIFGADSFYTAYTGLLHKYGPLLGLWASDHPYKGSIIEFRIDSELKAIVGEVWRFWPRLSMFPGDDELWPKLPEYFRFVHMALAQNEGGRVHAQLHWHVPTEGEDYYGPGTTWLSVPTLHVVDETDQEVTAHLMVQFTRRHVVHLPPIPPLESNSWYDRSRGLPRLRRDRSTVQARPPPPSLHSRIVSATSARIYPPALMIRPPSSDVPDPFADHEPPMPLQDVRNRIYGDADIGWFYRRFYPMRSLIRDGEDPRDAQWHPESLEGLWLGSYGSHGTEVLFLVYDSEAQEVQAWKVTGDMNVPRGACSWCIQLNQPLRPDECSNFRFGAFHRLYEGTGTVCSTGFVESERDTVRLIVSIESNDEIAINWSDLDLFYTPRYVRYKGRDVTSETREHFLRRPVGWTP